MKEWDEIYKLYFPDIYRFLIYFTHNHEDGEDLTQETFIKAFSKWDQFESRSSVKTWLLSIARNLAIDSGRYRKRSEGLQQLLQMKLHANSPLSNELTAVNIAKQVLYSAVQLLKPDFRAVLIIRGIQEYTVAESAEILGWTENKVKITYYRAIKSLRSHLMASGEKINNLA